MFRQLGCGQHGQLTARRLVQALWTIRAGWEVGMWGPGPQPGGRWPQAVIIAGPVNHRCSSARSAWPSSMTWAGSPTAIDAFADGGGGAMSLLHRHDVLRAVHDQGRHADAWQQALHIGQQQ